MPDAAGSVDCVGAAHEPYGLQRAQRSGLKADLVSGLHLRDTLLALSPAPVKPWEGKFTSNQQRNSTANRQYQPIPFETSQHVPTDENSLRANMRKLASIEPERVLLTRTIAQLGLNSEYFLRAHFQQFGTVEQVLVCHPIKKSGTGRGRQRVRPSNTGFVVMKSAEEVSAVLARGSVQIIQGASVGVSKYVDRQAELGLDAQ